MRRAIIPVLCLAILVWIITALGLVIYASYPSRTTMTVTKIAVFASKNRVKTGETFTVDIVITPGTDVKVAGVQLDLEFNPEAVRVDNVSQGNFLTSGGYQSYFMPGMINNDVGVVYNIAGSTLGPGSGATAAGRFATIQFTALAAGQAAGLDLDHIIIGNQDALAVPFDPPDVDTVSIVSLLDLDLSGSVDLSDLVLAAADLGAAGDPGWVPVDINQDGVVDILDLILIAQHFD